MRRSSVSGCWHAATSLTVPPCWHATRSEIGLAENGGDPTQDGCAFHVKDLEALFLEFSANGLNKERSEFKIEQRDNGAWKVFYVVAPDGLCYWFGERQPG